MLAFSGQLTGLGLVLKNLDTVSGNVKFGVNGALLEASKYLEEKVREKISLTDHTLKDLKDMGHPYSVRAPRKMHTGIEVHTRSGEMLAAFGSRVESLAGGGSSFSVGFGLTTLPAHVPWVLKGTRRMVSRPVVDAVINRNLTRVRKIVMDKVGKEMVSRLFTMRGIAP